MVNIEIVPAILRQSFEDIEHDWNFIARETNHIQIDVTDGVFAGLGSFRDLRRFKQLNESFKAELHMMVHNPGSYVDAIADLNPARSVFHIEAFEGGENIKMVFDKLRSSTQTELGLALNPASPIEWLEENLDLADFILFMSYNPGIANQPLDSGIFPKLAEFRQKHPQAKIAIDGHVNKETLDGFIKSGARILYANTAIFGAGEPKENLRQLQLLAQAIGQEIGKGK